MSSLDWMVLISATVFIVAYGIWKTRKNKNIDAYLMGGHTTRWWTVGLSVMATQASASVAARAHLHLEAPGKAVSVNRRLDKIGLLFALTARRARRRSYLPRSRRRRPGC